MARDPLAREIQENVPKLFAQKALAYGAHAVADLTDAEHKNVADEVLAEMAATTGLPDWIEKIRAAGATDADLMEVALGTYDLSPGEAIAKLRSDTLRAFGRDAEKPASSSPYGSPF